MTVLDAVHPQVTVDSRDVAWVDGKPRRIRINGEWMRVTATARPYRYRDRFPDGQWGRGTHAFKERVRRDEFMRRDIAAGYVVQPYEMTEDGPVFGPVYRSRRGILHADSWRRYGSKQHSAGMVSIADRPKTWCAEHQRHGCGPDCEAEYEQYGEWDHTLDPFRLGWQPYCRVDDKPDPPRKVQTALGEMTVYGIIGVPRIRYANQ